LTFREGLREVKRIKERLDLMSEKRWKLNREKYIPREILQRKKIMVEPTCMCLTLSRRLTERSVKGLSLE